MMSEQFGTIIQALSTGRNPTCDKPLTQDTILQILQHPQVQRALIYHAGKSSNHNSKEAGILQALADCQDPVTGNPLDKQDAWNLLQNPSVLAILKSAAGSSEPVADAPARFKHNTFIRVVIPLLILWLGIVIWWGLEHYSRQPGSIHDPVLEPYLERLNPPVKDKKAMASRSSVNNKESDRDLHRLREFLNRYSSRGLRRNKQSIPDQMDALVMSSPERLLPLINTQAFALLELDDSLANHLRQAGLKYLQVLQSGEETSSHCHAIDSWTWSVRELLSSGMTANLFRPHAVDGCAEKMPVQTGRVVAVWVGSEQNVPDDNLKNACTQVVFDRKGQSDTSSEPWLDVANCADGTSIYLAAGIGPESVMVPTKKSSVTQKRLSDILISLPVDQNIDSARYANYIALYHLGRVSRGKLIIEPGLLSFRQLVSGEGDIAISNTVARSPKTFQKRIQVRHAESRLNPDCRRDPVTHKSQTKIVNAPVTQAEDKTPKVLINRDPKVFDDVCAGDTLIFNIYAANIERVMLNFDNANAKDGMGGIQLIQPVNFQNSVKFTTPSDWHGFTTISATGFAKVDGKPFIAGNKVTFNIKPKTIQKKANNRNRAGKTERRNQRVPRGQSNVVVDKRTLKEFFENYIHLRNSFDPALKKLYARNALITHFNPTKRRTTTYSDDRGRGSLKRFRQELEANNEKGKFSGVKILKHSNGYKIKASRYSTYYCITDKQYYMIVESDTDGKLKIITERLSFPSEPECNKEGVAKDYSPEKSSSPASSFSEASCDLSHLNPIADTFVYSFPGNEKRNFGEREFFSAGEWTTNGRPFSVYAYLKFDLGCIPEDAIVKSAKLSLYPDTVHNLYGQGKYNSESPGHSTLSGTNAFYIQKITEEWGEMSVNWYSKPGLDETHQVVVKGSDVVDENTPEEYQSGPEKYFLDMEIVDLINDIREGDNFGIGLKMQNESYYREVNFRSRENTKGLVPVLKIELE